MAPAIAPRASKGCWGHFVWISPNGHRCYDVSRRDEMKNDGTYNARRYGNERAGTYLPGAASARRLLNSARAHDL